MKTILFSFTLLFLTTTQSYAQQFISKARIEYEVKSNIKKTMGNNVWEEMLKNKLPDIKTVYYNYSFADNKSVYRFGRWADNIPAFLKRGDDENVWYLNFNTDDCTIKKNIYGSPIIIADSIPQFKWKLENENRMIAGFNCRKAVAVIFDSVYVFAFYTEEITIPGGPGNINGLPGMILGVTIPRLYTSWIATKVMLEGVNVANIKPETGKNVYTFKGLQTLVEKRREDWYSNDDEEAKEINERKDRDMWSLLL